MSYIDFFRGKSVLVTGASSGIGRTLALQLGAAGAQLTLTARRSELLAQLAEEVVSAGAVRPVISVCDVTRDGDLERAVADAVGAFSKLDVVFANAGFGIVGSFDRLTLSDYRRQFETNVFGVLRTLKACQAEISRHRGQHSDHRQRRRLLRDAGQFTLLHEQVRDTRTRSVHHPGACTGGRERDARQSRIRREQYPQGG